MESNTNEVLPVTAGEMRPEADEAVTTTDQWAQIEAAYLGGETAKAVAERFGVRPQQIYDRVGANGKLAQRRRGADGDTEITRTHAALRAMIEAMAVTGRALELIGR